MKNKQTKNTGRAAEKLENISWLATDDMQKVFSAFERFGAEIRAVGGAVRNTILGEDVSDVDLATTANPEEIMKFAGLEGFRVVPVGIEFGSVMLLSDHSQFEVTTLRKDVKTDGRHATVEFGTDWSMDARRRDFTMNALYLDKDGYVYDYVGGLEDCRNRRLEFIGSAEQRIREDYLRILRYFRFLASYADHEPDDRTLAAITGNLNGLKRLSRERIQSELMKILESPKAGKVVACMNEAGILKILFGGSAFTEQLDVLLNSLSELNESADGILRLYALAVNSVEDAERISEKLVLSKKDRNRLLKIHEAANQCESFDSDFDISLLLYRHGRQAAKDGMLISQVRHGRTMGEVNWSSVLSKAESLEIPEYPVSGKDLLSAGFSQGRTVGEKLKEGEKIWINSGFTLGLEEILKKLTEI